MANDVFGNKAIWGEKTLLPAYKTTQAKKSEKPLPIAAGDGNSSSYKPRGAATSYDSQYKIDEYSYPIDLMNSEYGSNYAVFYINVSVDSKLAKGPKDLYVNDVPVRDRGDAVGQNITKSQAVTGSAVEGAVAAGAAGAILKGDASGAAGGVAAAGAISYVGVSAVQSQSSSLKRQQKRLKTAIALHVPNQLSIRYGMNWGEEDTSTFMMGAKGAESIGKFLEEGGKIDQLSGPAKTIAAAIALNKLPGAAAISALSGMAPNPKKEQVFKNVDFRTFQFQYEFYPRSPKEAEYVLNIIKQFKLHMHPEYKDSSNFLYVYPSEFDIYYYQGTSENLNVHRHTSCVLTEMTVNYSPQGQFVTFDNGMPTQINITLNFRELGMLSKEKIEDGF